MTTTLNPPVPADAASRPYHWTVEAYYRAWEAGAFEADARLELIHGRIIEKMPISPIHAEVADYLADCLRAALSPRLKVREEKPIRIAFDGEPIPDISVVVDDRERYRQQHPTPEDVELLVEIAVSSVELDTGEKALLYAQAGIADYWVVLPSENAIVVHREPTPDGYQSVIRLGEADAVSLLAASDVSLSVHSLLSL